jgi:hypothetical protein
MLLVACISVACAARASTPPHQRPMTNGLVLRINVHGGFLAPAYALTRIPQFSLYADGLIIMEGAQIELYPGPAISPVFSMKVDTAGMRTILEAVRKAGLDRADRTYDHPAVADAPTTTFTFIENGKKHVISAYALGMEAPPTAPESERKARKALYELETRLGNLRGWLPEGSLSAERPFDYKGLAVIVSTQPSDEQLQQAELAWPLDRSIADLAKPVVDGAVSCIAVSGQDVERLRPLVAKANELTPWKSDAKTYWLRFRPLLPDESGCPEL